MHQIECQYHNEFRDNRSIHALLSGAFSFGTKDDNYQYKIEITWLIKLRYLLVVVFGE